MSGEIDGWVLTRAADLLDYMGDEVHDVHTVTLITNGQHGGVDMIIEGFTADFNPYKVTEVLQ